MKHTIHLLTTLLLLALLAACVPVETSEPASDNTAAEATSAPEEEANDEATDEIAASDTYQVPGFPPYAPPPTMLEVVEDKGDTAVVRHMMGEVEIPKNPQRVYAQVDTASVALLLDLNLVGSEDWGDYAALPNYDELFDGVEVIGSGDTSMEHILTLDPDLILVQGSVMWPASGNQESTYQQLSEIAPTIVFNENMYSNWQQGALDLAEALGLEDEAEAKLEQFDSDIEEACAPLKAAIGDEGVVRLSIWSGNLIVHTVGFYDSTGENFMFAGDTIWLYVYCGLLPPEDLTNVIPVSSEDGNEELSAELIPQINAEHIFVVSGEEGAEALLDDPLWQTVPAVQNGNVYYLPNVSSYSADLALNAINTAAEAIEEANARE